nr:hypothetical protein [Burkholderia dolosa]
MTVTVPAVPPKDAVLPALHGVAVEPLNQLAVVLSHVPEPPPPPGPQLKVCAPAAVDAVASSSVAARIDIGRTTCRAARRAQALRPVPPHAGSRADATRPPFARSSSDAATQAPTASFQIVLNDLFIFVSCMANDVAGDAVLVLRFAYACVAGATAPVVDEIRTRRRVGRFPFRVKAATPASYRRENGDLRSRW